jgi:hypothetical protein
MYGFGAGGGEKKAGQRPIPDWLPGAVGVISMAVVGTLILYFPLRKKFREAGR